MRVNGREIIFRNEFVDKFKEISAYIGEKSILNEVNFIKELNIMVFVTIPKRPFSFQEFAKKPTASKVYRRSLFKKKWNIIYKVETTRLVFLYIYHSSQNVNKIKVNG